MSPGRAASGLLVVALLAGLALLAGGGLRGGGPAAGKAATTPVATPASGATVDLAGFLARAERADRQLRAATELVEGDLPTGHLREATRRACGASATTPRRPVSTPSTWPGCGRGRPAGHQSVGSRQGPCQRPNWPSTCE